MTWLFGMQGEDGKRLSRPLLRRAAALAWGWRALPELARSGRGKPYFRHWPEKWFSLSHSGGLTLCALSDDGPVGVDVEVERPRRPGLMAYALSPAEQAACRGDWGEFYRLWTLKESWCKREDSPLDPPREVVTPPPCPHRSYTGPGWRGAVCCSGTPPEDVLWMEPEETP